MKRFVQQWGFVLAVMASITAPIGCNNRVGSDGSGASDRILPRPVSAKALSNHYIEVRLESAAVPSSVRHDAFRIQALDSEADLRILAAELSQSGHSVVLMTDPQEPRAYRLTVPGADAQSNGISASSQGILFSGSTLDEPRLLSAVALDNTTVLLSFSEQLNPVTAEYTKFYHIADPDGDPDIDISIDNAMLGPQGTTVFLTTTPQENHRYTILVSNVDAAFVSSSTCRGVEYSLAASTTSCAAQIRPADSEGAGAPFVLSAQTRIDSSAPPEADDAGLMGHVYRSVSGVGVVSASCSGSSTISGSGFDDDEELIITFDAPYQHEIITLGFHDLAFASDTPVFFASSEFDTGFGAAILEDEIVTATTITGSQTGRVFLGAIPSLPTGQFIDILKIRETTSYTMLASVCLSASRKINPEAREATFFGIPQNDPEPPIVVNAVATGINTVLVSFSEPLREGAANPINFTFSPDLTVLSAESTLYNTQVILTTTPMTQGVEYTLTVSNVQDLAGNVIGDGTVADAGTEVSFTFPGGTVFDGEEHPRVVGAVSIDNSTVIVTFSKPMGDSAEVADHYSIMREGNNPSGGALQVTDAQFYTPAARTSVRLTTLPQSQVHYRLTVVNVDDLQGNELAAAELLVDPSSVTFLGTPPPSACRECQVGAPNAGQACISDDDCDDDGTCDEGEADCEGMCVDPCSTDSDGDGLADAAEEAGWLITVLYANGDQVTSVVTSDPNEADTDGDGISDLDERLYGSNPRSSDTDADGLTDYEELNEWYSDPWNQDTDGDGYIDGLDVSFGTSPILADTDGDQMDDNEELEERNRNPLIADLPIPQVSIGEFSLGLDITSSFTDEAGMTQSTSTTNSSTFTQSQTTSLGTSATNSTETENMLGGKIGGEGGVSGGTYSFKVSLESSFAHSWSQGYSSTVDRQSSETAQQEYQQSVTDALEFSESRSVTRNIDAAIVQATVNISNRSNIAFSITNIELSMLHQDRLTGLSFRPIATLRPTGADDPLGQPVFNIAPREQNRGPIIFESTSIFPNRVDDLMREPTGLVFRVVNYDVLDELGRNLVFTSQEVSDKTVAITIDFGDGRVETYNVATASKYGPDGRQVGIDMERALEIIGLTHDALGAVDQARTYATETVSRDVNGQMVMVEVLARLRDVANSADGTKFWTAVSSNTDLDPNSDFMSIPLHAHDTMLILFTSDEDEDGLFLREEYLYGSDDTLANSDDDGMDDYEEVRVGWTVFKVPGLPYLAFPSPSRQDSDLDGLEDHEEAPSYIGVGDNGICDTTDILGDDFEVELADSSICVQAGLNRILDTSPAADDVHVVQGLGTDPNRADTDEDGRSDASEIGDTYLIALFDPNAAPADPPVVLTVKPYNDWAITAGPNGQCTQGADCDDVYVGVPDTLESKLCVVAGPNGILDTLPQFDNKRVAAPNIDAGPDGTCQTTTPAEDDLLAPINADGIGKICISAGANEVIDTTPVGDDFIRVAHRGLYGTDPLHADTDGDGLNDGREILLGTNPNSKDAGRITDTDGDGLVDDEEDVCMADPNLPDTDHDGIPDLIECRLGFDARSLDGDGDTLVDYLEFDPRNLGWTKPDGTVDRYPPVILATALQRCEAAPNCHYVPPMESDRFGTHPARVDSDEDGRDDGVEVTQPWTVDADTLTGPVVLEVRSNPAHADVDNDGLIDCQELGEATDPNDGDTDDDGTSDGREVATCRDHDNNAMTPDICRNALVPDRLLNFKFIEFETIDDCDDHSGIAAEIGAGILYLDTPVGTTTIPIPDARHATEHPICDGEENGRVDRHEDMNFSQTFRLVIGQSFSVRNDTNMRECDSGSDGDHLKDVTVSFAYTDVSGLTANIESIPAKEFVIEWAGISPGDDFHGGADCRFKAHMRITPLDDMAGPRVCPLPPPPMP